jgi:acyl-coenzyme A thioesterase PaaI-like protein
MPPADADAGCQMTDSVRIALSARSESLGDDAVMSTFTVGARSIDVRVDRLRPAQAADLVATGMMVKAGRRVSVVDVEVRDARGQVAVGRGPNASPEASA